MKRILILSIFLTLILCGCGTSEPVEEPEEVKVDYSAYETLLNDTCDENGPIYTYSAYDIDKDGIRDLILKTGISESDYVYEFYTLDENSTLVNLGSIAGASSMLYANEKEEGLIKFHAKQGHNETVKITLADSKIVETTLEGTVDRSSYIDSPLREIYIDDFYLLEEEAQLIADEEDTYCLDRDVKSVLNRKIFRHIDPEMEGLSSWINGIETITPFVEDWTYGELMNEEYFSNITWYNSIDDRGVRLIVFEGDMLSTGEYVEFVFGIDNSKDGPKELGFNSCDAYISVEDSIKEGLQEGFDEETSRKFAETSLAMMFCIAAYM